MKRLEQANFMFLTAAIHLCLVFAWTGLSQGQDRGWEKEWEKTTQAAKKEGQLVFHSGDATEAFFSEFQKKFPEIKVTRMLTRGGNAAVQRLMSERRAGLYSGDILIIGASSVLTMVDAKALDPVEPVMILPEVLDKSKWWEGKHHYADKEGKFLLKFGASPQVDVGYNNKLVNPNEIKSYRDLLNPKWKGRIVTLDPIEARGGAGVSFRFMYYHP